MFVSMFSSQLYLVSFSVIATQSVQYHFIDTLKSWDEAQSYCQTQFGTDLASIHSEADFQVALGVCQIPTGSDGCWIGLNDYSIEGEFEWIDGSVFDYGNDTSGGVYPWSTYNGGQPNHQSGEDCVRMRRNTPEPLWWQDSTCSTGTSFLCNTDTAASSAPSPTSVAPTTASPTSAAPTTASPTSVAPTTASPTSAAPTTASPTSAAPTTASPTSVAPTTASPTETIVTTAPPTTDAPPGTTNFASQSPTEKPIAESTILTAEKATTALTEYRVTMDFRSGNVSCEDALATMIDAIDSDLPQFTVEEEACDADVEEDQDVTATLLVAVAADVPVVYDVIESTLQEAMAEEHGIDVDVSVSESDAPKSDHPQADDTQDWSLLFWFAVGAGGVCVIGVLVAGAMLVRRSRRRTNIDEANLSLQVIESPVQRKPRDKLQVRAEAREPVQQSEREPGAPAGGHGRPQAKPVTRLTLGQPVSHHPQDSEELYVPQNPTIAGDDIQTSRKIETREASTSSSSMSLPSEEVQCTQTTTAGATRNAVKSDESGSHCESWTSDEVVRWMVDLNYEAHKRYETKLREAFASDVVNGKALIGINDGYLAECGVTRSVHRQTILQNIQKLLSSEPESKPRVDAAISTLNML